MTYDRVGVVFALMVTLGAIAFVDAFLRRARVLDVGAAPGDVDRAVAAMAQ
jgi:hypothetical protein